MTADGDATAPRRRQFLILLALVAALGLCWIVGNPRSSGPDEPSHMVASAGFVRLDGGTTIPGLPGLQEMRVPQMAGAPDPVCFAQQPDQPVECVGELALNDGIVVAVTTSADYPPWALVLPGLASFVPWPDGHAYLARSLSSVVAVLLVAWSITEVLARRPIMAVSALLGTTPIVWFTVGTVNPSSVAIAGGLALWAALLVLPDDRRVAPLALAGWAALLLARRDGPVWAAAIVIGACAISALRPSDLWRLLPRWQRYAALVLPTLPFVPILARGDVGFDLALAGATIAIAGCEAFQIAWTRGTRRWLTIGVTAAACLVAATGIAVLRPGGFDGGLIRLVVTNTGDHLYQLVGVLGWLDAPVPMSAVVLFWAALGALAGVTVIEHPRAAVVATAGLLAALAIAWLLELGQGSSYGEYWQGRYTMPFVVGVPLALAVRRDASALIDQLSPVIAAIVWIILNLGFFAAQRRWAVGISGTWNPVRWDTWDAPVPPVVMLVLHAGVSAALLVVASGRNSSIHSHRANPA